MRTKKQYDIYWSSEGHTILYLCVFYTVRVAWTWGFVGLWDLCCASSFFFISSFFFSQHRSMWFLILGTYWRLRALVTWRFISCIASTMILDLFDLFFDAVEQYPLVCLSVSSDGPRRWWCIDVCIVNYHSYRCIYIIPLDTTLPTYLYELVTTDQRTRSSLALPSTISYTNTNATTFIWWTIWWSSKQHYVHSHPYCSSYQYTQQ